MPGSVLGIYAQQQLGQTWPLSPHCSQSRVESTPKQTKMLPTVMRGYRSRTLAHSPRKEVRKNMLRPESSRNRPRSGPIPPRKGETWTEEQARVTPERCFPGPASLGSHWALLWAHWSLSDRGPKGQPKCSELQQADPGAQPPPPLHPRVIHGSRDSGRDA